MIPHWKAQIRKHKERVVEWIIWDAYFLHSKILFPFWNILSHRHLFLKKLKIEKIDTFLKSPNERTIRLISKVDSIEGRMLIFSLQKYLFYFEISIYSDRWSLKNRKKWLLIKKEYNSNPGWSVWPGPGPCGRLFHETSNFDN